MKNETFIQHTYSHSSITHLVSTSNFAVHAIEHIFEGQVNRQGHAVGYHYEEIQNTSGETLPSSEQLLNEFGCYTAKVKVSGIEKTSNNGLSSFFPKSMSPQQVIDSINEAYNNCIIVPETINMYQGNSNNGLSITLFLNKNNKIISAFPTTT